MTLAGEVARSRARSSGTLIVLLDARNGGDWIASEDEGGRWITFCDDHGGFVQHTNRATARSWMAWPQEWCSECHELPEHAAVRVNVSALESSES